MDLKCAAIILGMQTASSKYPCIYGECTKTTKKCMWKKGKERTLESLSSSQERWMSETGGNRKQLMNYRNVEFQPLLRPISDNSNSSTKILTKVPPPPLHTFRLGPVNHVIKCLSNHYPNLKKKLSDLNVVEERYHGTGYEGNECKKILNNIDKLEIPDNLADFKDVLYKLQDVNKLVSCPVLPDNYKEVIRSWRESWNQLFKNGQITETNKIHILNDHLEVSRAKKKIGNITCYITL